MKKSIRQQLLAILCFMLCVTPIVTAAEFRADVVQGREIEVRQGYIWVKDGIYRLEMEQPNGPALYIIAGAKPGMTQVVLPAYKAYVEMPSDGFMSVMNDPFQSAEITAKQYTVKNEGKETVQGFKCERQLIHLKGSGILRRWMAFDPGFPIKIEELLKEDQYVRLKNIEKGSVPKAQFQIPAGFTLKTEEQVKALIEADPAVAAKVAAYQKNRPRKLELRALLSGRDSWKVKVVCREEYGSVNASSILLDEPFSSNGPGMAASAAASPGAEASATWTGSAARAETAAPSSSKGGDHASRMVLVLDASGSMWGQIKGKAKIDIAKEVISDLIDAIPADFQTGLSVYGHRRKGDCNDIEMMIPVGEHNAAALKAKVATISPKGKTPLSEAVKRAAEALHYTNLPTLKQAYFYSI